MGMAAASITNTGPRTVARALREATYLLFAAGIASARLDAEVLLRHVLELKQEALFLNYSRPLTGEEQELFWRVLARRAAREPIAYITGRKEFWSLDFLVTPDVLIPRPETECLVETALRLAGRMDNSDSLKVLDLGTGSGAVAVCLHKELPDAEIWATDISSAALDIARINGDRHGAGAMIHWAHGDLFRALAGRKESFQLIVSNPPYIRTGELANLSPEIGAWEPRSALDGGADGLDYYRRIIAEGHRYLTGGYIVLEIGADMADEVARLFASTGSYLEASVHGDYAGKDRVIAAKRLP